MPARYAVPLVVVLLFGAFELGRFTAPDPAPAWGGAKSISTCTNTVITTKAPPNTVPLAPFFGAAALDGGMLTVERTTRPRSPPANALDVLEPQDCLPQLLALQTRVKAEREERQANEGAPLPPPDDKVEPRFSQQQLQSSLTRAFGQSGVPGGVNGVDCNEYPCLVYGRIRGSEDFMERLEQTKALAAYEEDIMVALMWTVTDEAERPAANARGVPERAEQTLFTIALYPRGERARLGDVLDRRIRARTFMLWNTQSPVDETGR
ncbi:MAG: hypothetical protein U0228_30310 [Myxococcaceae bacterium]